MIFKCSPYIRHNSKEKKKKSEYTIDQNEEIIK